MYTITLKEIRESDDSGLKVLGECIVDYLLGTKINKFASYATLVNVFDLISIERDHNTDVETFSFDFGYFVATVRVKHG